MAWAYVAKVVPLFDGDSRAQPSLRARAMRFLARREHSRAELQRKLSAVAEEGDNVEALLDDLAKKGWLSDARFAEQIIRSKARRFGPLKARHLLRAVSGAVPMAHLAMHFHDTYGQALANLYAGMEEGARVIDSAAGGLGGCPYAPGATGNVATEDVVYMLEGMGIATRVDMPKLVAATNEITKQIGRAPVSRVAAALNAKRANSE